MFSGFHGLDFNLSFVSIQSRFAVKYRHTKQYMPSSSCHGSFILSILQATSSGCTLAHLRLGLALELLCLALGLAHKLVGLALGLSGSRVGLAREFVRLALCLAGGGVGLALGLAGGLGDGLLD